MANAVWLNQGTPITFQDSGGTVALTLNNLATVVGRISARYDKGADPFWYRAIIMATVQLATTGTLGEQVEIYVSWSDGTHPDGEVGTADAALGTDKRRNLKLALLLYSDQTATNTDMSASAVIEIPSRYFSIGVWNATTDNLRATNNTSIVTVIPIYDEIQ